MSRLDWENTNIGDPILQNLLIAKDDNDDIFLRLDTTTKNQEIYQYEDEAQASPNGMHFACGSAEFADDIMDKISEAVTNCFKVIQNHPERSTFIAPMLKKALSKRVRAVKPIMLCLTGVRNEIYVILKLVTED